MTKATNTLQIKVERTIPASPGEVFDAWLDPKVAGTPWSQADRLLLNPVVDGFFYWLIRGTPHYGRFTQLQRPSRMQYTWMSPNTLGNESIVTVTFTQRGGETLMSLEHTGLPETDSGRGHEKGWTYFVGGFADELARRGVPAA